MIAPWILRRPADSSVSAPVLDPAALAAVNPAALVQVASVAAVDPAAAIPVASVAAVRAAAV